MNNTGLLPTYARNLDFQLEFFTQSAGKIELGWFRKTVTNYIITSSLAAPALLELGVPLIVSHMFVFYFGIMADLTPPVALAAFAAAPIAKVAAGAYTAGFGDINAIIQNAATRPGEAPVMVYMLYNRAPFALITKADSPIKSLKDVEGKTVSFSSPGSSTNLVLLNLFDHYKVKGKATPTGGIPGTFTQVMSKQIDVGWSVPPFGLKEQASGEAVMAHVPSHHDHHVGEWIGIRAEVDHVVTFPRVAVVAD